MDLTKGAFLNGFSYGFSIVFFYGFSNIVFPGVNSLRNVLSFHEASINHQVVVICGLLTNMAGRNLPPMMTT